jgi:hypothetical protein
VAAPPKPTLAPKRDYKNHAYRTILDNLHDYPALDGIFDLWDQLNNLVHGNDKTTRESAKRQGAVTKIKHLHTQQDSVLAAHRSGMFMQDNQHDLNQYLHTRRTNNLINWVNIWQPAITPSIKSSQALAVDTMGRMDDHFDHLTRTAKPPPRSRVPPRFHTRHDRN